MPVFYSDIEGSTRLSEQLTNGMDGDPVSYATEAHKQAGGAACPVAISIPLGTYFSFDRHLSRPPGADARP